MADSATIAKRRQAIADLWLRGVPVLRIATTLKVPHRTVRSDIEAIRHELQQDRIEEVEQRRDRSLAALRRVQTEAWTLFYRLADGSSSKVGALNTIRAVEHEIMQLEGTLETRATINQTTNISMAQDEWQAVQQTIMHALQAHPEAKLDVAQALMKMNTHGQLN